MIAHTYKPKRKKNGKTVVARIYRGRYRLDGDFAVTDVALKTQDKQVAEKRLKEIVSEAEKERAGIISPRVQREAAQIPLSEHLKDFLDHLKAVGRTEDYRIQISRRLKRLFNECASMHVKDVTPNVFGAWRVKQTDKKPKTLNEYLNALNTLFNWMVKQERIAYNPVANVERVDLRGKQQRRRAFTDDEFERLLQVAPAQRPLYLTAAYTGLRLNELRQLIWADIHLDHERPHIIARAGTTKNRKEAMLPLHSQLAEELRKIKPENASLGERVFNILTQPDKQFKRNLERAGIEPIDALDRKIDFHALRYTFATKLAKEGVAQRMAQELMRHSDPRLTAMIYTDPSQLPTFESVESLPWHEKADTHNDTQIDSQKVVSEGLDQSQNGAGEQAQESPETLGFQGFSPALAMTGADGQMAEREGFEPSVELPPHILSRDAQSATLSPLLGKRLNKLTVALRSIEIDFLDNYLLKWDVDSPMDRL